MGPLYEPVECQWKTTRKLKPHCFDSILESQHKSRTGNHAVSTRSHFHMPLVQPQGSCTQHATIMWPNSNFPDRPYTLMEKVPLRMCRVSMYHFGGFCRHRFQNRYGLNLSLGVDPSIHFPMPLLSFRAGELVRESVWAGRPKHNIAHHQLTTISK